MNNNTCCFTGHRPDKLFGYDLGSPLYRGLFLKTEREVKNLIENKGVTRFIVGGALGFDSLAFLVIYGLKKEYDIELEIAVPFRQQYIKWNSTSIDFFLTSIQLADRLTEVDKLEGYKVRGLEEEVYHPIKMQKRNEYMVNESKYVIACWNGSKGGTYNAIKYAQNLGDRECIIINPREEL